MDNERPWYHAAFGDRYSRLYAHRDDAMARREIDFLLGEIGSPIEGTVLDLACGAGRHLRALEDARVRALGLDLSRSLLAEAREARPRTRVVRGDMRRLPFASARFAAVFQLFTAFGYFHETSEDARVLTEVARVLVPGGHHVLDFLDVDHLRAKLVRTSRRDVDGWQVHERRWIDDDRVHKEVTVLDAHEAVLHRHQEAVRLYTRSQLTEMLAAAGLRVVSAYGAYDGRAAGTGDRCLLVSERMGT